VVDEDGGELGFVFRFQQAFQSAFRKFYKGFLGRREHRKEPLTVKISAKPMALTAS